MILSGRSSSRRCRSLFHRMFGPAPVLWFVLLLGIWGVSIPCLGASSSPVKDLEDPEKPWHILADEVHHDRQADVYMASGNVVVQRGDVRIAADRIRFDHKSMQALAEGHVTISSGKDLITARQADLDLAKETGVLIDGSLFASENHFYFRGDRIEKVGPDSYTADRATVTTCDGDKPDWKITGRDLSITIEGYGTVRHATFWAGPVPVLYSPWMGFPVKIKRQSGFLPPQFGLSDRKGFEYLQPFYWAIDESSDATFYGHTMSYRGNRFGAEYRYVLDAHSRGTVMADGFSDRKVDDGSTGSEEWGYAGDNLLRPYTDRYWFRMKHDQALPADFTAKLDLDIVSDQDYLQEFKTGYTGFEQTRDEFLDTFGREIDEFTETTRVNRLNLSRIWPSYSLNAEARWYDDVVKRRYEEIDDTLQKLPFVTFDASRQPLFSTPAYFDFQTEYVRFYRLEGGDRGHRVDLYPRVYFPMRYRHIASVEPSFGLRETVWNIDHEEKPTPQTPIDSHRESYDAKLDITSELYRIYDVGGQDVDRIQHQIRPEVIYEYVPDQDQSALPLFDDTDRIQKRNTVTYSLTNTLISRSLAPAPAEGKAKKTAEGADEAAPGKPDVAGAEADGSDGPGTEGEGAANNEVGPGAATGADGEASAAPSVKYRDFLRLKFQQSYDINEANQPDDPRPFSPILAELEFNPSSYIDLKADAQWSIYDAAFVGHNLSTTLRDDRGDELSAEYRYTRDSKESIVLDALAKVSDAVSLIGEYEENLKDNRKLATGVGILYKSQCWSVEVKYLEEVDDKSITFMVNLLGLGAVGSGVGVGGQ